MQGCPSFRRALCLGLLAISLVTASVWADESSLWAQLTAPYGGIATRIAMAPATPADQFLLVPDQGIYGTTDTGAHWTLLRPSIALLDMALDPQQPATLYALTGHNAVTKTTDAGASWHEMSTGLPVTVDTGSEVHVVVDPVTEGTAYVITWQQGVYKTVDGGAHWSAINTGIGSLEQAGAGIHSLSVDPSNDQVLYLDAWSSKDVVTGLPGLGIAGVYQSTDGGAHWNQVLSGESTWSLGVQPGNDQDLFVAGTYNYYTSTDGGAHWTGSHASSVPVFDTEFLFDPTNPQHMWVGGSGGMAVSTDGGATWLIPNGDDGSTNGVMYLAVDSTGTKLYAAWSGPGAGVSSDDGSTWQFLSTGIDDVKVSQMMVGSDGAIYLGTSTGGLYRGSDAGGGWTPADTGLTGDAAAPVKQMVEDSATSTLFMVNGSLFKSVDDGADWTRVTEPLSGAYGAVAVTPGSPSTVYVSQMQGVQKSTDDGANWVTVNTGLPFKNGVPALAASPADPDKAFAGTNNAGLYSTSDGGAHWSHVDGLEAGSVLAVAIDPSQPGTVYAASQGTGIFKSTDGGSTWSATGLNYDSIVLISIDPADSDVLVAMSQTPGKVYLSADAGASWTLLDTSDTAVSEAFGFTRTASSSMPQGPSLAALAMDPKQKGTMYAADQQGNMYKVSVAQLVADLSKSSAASSSSSGGGALSLLTSALLFGFAALRRRR